MKHFTLWLGALLLSVTSAQRSDNLGAFVGESCVCDYLKVEAYLDGKAVSVSGGNPYTLSTTDFLFSFNFDQNLVREFRGSQTERYHTLPAADAAMLRSLLGSPPLTRVQFVLQNRSNSTLRLHWDESVFIQTNRRVSRVAHQGVKYNDINQSQPPSLVPRGALLEDFVVPTASISFNNNAWVEEPFLRQLTPGTTFGLNLTIEVAGKKQELNLSFTVTKALAQVPEHLGRLATGYTYEVRGLEARSSNTFTGRVGAQDIEITLSGVSPIPARQAVALRELNYWLGLSTNWTVKVYQLSGKQVFGTLRIPNQVSLNARLIEEGLAFFNQNTADPSEGPELQAAERKRVGNQGSVLFEDSRYPLTVSNWFADDSFEAIVQGRRLIIRTSGIKVLPTRLPAVRNFLVGKSLEIAVVGVRSGSDYADGTLFYEGGNLYAALIEQGYAELIESTADPRFINDLKQAKSRLAAAPAPPAPPKGAQPLRIVRVYRGTYMEVAYQGAVSMVQHGAFIAGVKVAPTQEIEVARFIEAFANSGSLTFTPLQDPPYGPVYLNLYVNGRSLAAELILRNLAAVDPATIDGSNRELLNLGR